MLTRIKILAYSLPLLLIAGLGCKKGTFDINNNNPNQPSNASPDYVLSAAMVSSASVAQGGDEDFLQWYMGYWAVSGDFIPSAQVLTYNINTDFYSDNWNSTYITLANYDYVLKHAPSANYAAIANIMEVYSYERLLDMYNNIPYSQALNAGINNYPVFEDAKTIYPKLVARLDSSVSIISSTASTPAAADVMFGGDMGKWTRFANTLKLRILMNLTQTDASFIQAHITGLTSSNLLQAGEDVSVNPGYSNSADNQQNPLWGDIGFNTTNAPHGDNSYIRANSYAVNFYANTNDPRLTRYYAANNAGGIQGRAFGSTNLEHNTTISGVNGPGVLKSPSQDAILMPASESFFLQAEAYQRGLLQGDAQAAYQQGVIESFRLLGVETTTETPEMFAATYTAQNDPRVNWSAAPDKITLIITQAWAAYNVYDPLEAWNNWRRLGIPVDLPVSIYPGTTATHIPYRLEYPTSEYKYNSSNVNAEGTIDPLSSKVYFMP